MKLLNAGLPGSVLRSVIWHDRALQYPFRAGSFVLDVPWNGARAQPRDRAFASQLCTIHISTLPAERQYVSHAPQCRLWLP
jgi:hypothetical protein